jgi:hypothetical protein
MNLTNQILTIIGLIFEILSVLYQASKTFHPFKSQKQKKDNYIIEKGKKISEKIEDIEKTWFWTLLLLVLGLFLQAIAVLEIL